MKKNIIVTDMGSELRRVSRWIKVRHAENITPRHELYYWAENSRGYRCIEGDSDGANVYYFVFRRRRYALNEFMPITFPEIYETPDERGVIAYMQIETTHPLLLEYSECMDFVRVYEEI